MKKSKLIILVFALVAFLLPLNVNATKRQVEEKKEKAEYVAEKIENVLKKY